jgi:CRISPR-associated endonuclease Cas1
MALPDLEAIYRRESSDPAVMVADGQNVTICVRNGQLRVSDGVRSCRRDRTVSRVPKSISHLIIIGSIGYITFEAVRWCAAENIAISQHDNDGKVILSGMSRDYDFSLLRSQVLVAAEGNESLIAVEIMRHIISVKLTGQLNIVRDIFNDFQAAGIINSQIDYLRTAPTLKAIMGHEGRGAAGYWQAWKNVMVPFSPTDLVKIPIHWTTFQGRNSAPGATDPINALLNYIYRVAETEARHACHMNGLEPTIGFSHTFHVSHANRNDMALDLMEAIRPSCDRFILSLLDTGGGIPADSKGRPRYFPYTWVYELQHGITRLFPPLTHMIAEQAASLAADIAPVTAEVVHQLRHVKERSQQGTIASKALHVRRYAPSRVYGEPVPSTVLEKPSCPADVIPDEAWRIISRHIPARDDTLGPVNDRAIVAGLVWCAANNRPITRCPESLKVHAATIYKRKKKWEREGAWQHITHAIRRTVLPGYR